MYYVLLAKKIKNSWMEQTSYVFAFSKLMLLFKIYSEILIRCQSCGALSFLMLKNSFFLSGD